jgi:mannosylglycerate hydrolase MGH1-like protein
LLALRPGPQVQGGVCLALDSLDVADDRAIEGRNVWPVDLHQVAVTPNFVPLYAGIPDEGRARRMVEGLEKPSFGLEGEEIVPVPSYDRYGFAFFPTRYWRGPVWISINWFLMRGLERYGFEVAGESLRLDARELRKCPTTWAKRLAYGHDPRAVCVKANAHRR